MHRFFAVTVRGSLYEVTDEKGENDWPIVRRISGADNPGMPNGTCLRNGYFVGIGETGICLFNFHPRHSRYFERMNTINWGGSTSGLVALFFDRKSAEACIATGDLESLSDRYREQTVAVLREIGGDHEAFSIGDSFLRHYELSFEPKTTR